MTKDEEQIAKAKEEIAERGEENGTKDQTRKDIKDEIVAAEEKKDGNENSQSAKARIEEADGTKEADEKKDEGKEQGGDDKAKDDKEYVSKSDFEKLATRVEEIFTQMQNMGKAPERADDERAKRLDRVAGIYND